jgi:S1-C subfamily serine protease
MKWFQSSVLCCSIVFAILAPRMALPQTVTLEAQRMVVVKLRIHRKNQSSEETAAAVYVGKDKQHAYFITARHAVISETDSQEIPVQSVKLQFYNAPGSFDATVFDHTDAILDLAVVQIPAVNLLADMPQIVTKDPAAGVSVRIVGHPPASSWSVWSGTVQNEYASGGDSHNFTTSRDASLVEGFSGGPVFDSEGDLLGTHHSTDVGYGRSARVGEILLQLRAWQIPTNNLTATRPEADQDAIRKVLDLYADAYNHLDAETLWKIWPSSPPRTKQAIENAFKSAASIKMNLQVGTPDIATDSQSATVRGQCSQTFVPRKGSAQPSRTDDIAFSLKRNGGAWVIVDVK